MTWATPDEIEYNAICAFQTSDSDTPGYCIVRWTGNEYILHEKYACHAFNAPIIIPEGELVFPDKLMTPMRKTSY